MTAASAYRSVAVPHGRANSGDVVVAAGERVRSRRSSAISAYMCDLPADPASTHPKRRKINRKWPSLLVVAARWRSVFMAGGTSPDQLARGVAGDRPATLMLQPMVVF